MESNEKEVMQKRNEAKTFTNFSINSQKLNLSTKKNAKQQEQRLRKLYFNYESSKAITSHRNKYLKDILHKYRGVFGDTSTVRKLLERSEESDLCLDEIFHAELIIMKFHNYVVNSQADDLLSFMRCPMDRAKFTSQRIPIEWTVERKGWTSAWNRAVKFLYEQATHRDLTFDYLQVFNLGLDRDTRIPLNVDALYSLWLENGCEKNAGSG